MNLTIPLGPKMLEVELNLPDENIVVAQSPIHPHLSFPRIRGERGGAGNWEELAIEALRHPIGAKRLSEHDFASKKVTIIVDDKTRSTPAYRLIPAVLDELKHTSVSDSDITFVAACGEHEGMNEDEMKAKFGEKILANYRTIYHDAFDTEGLAFCGFSQLANPIWVNKAVAEADFVIAIGRIALHYNFGYAGGAKMIVPGVVGAETITYNHAMFCAPNSGVGHLDDHPARQDAEDIAEIVGLDFILNILTNRRSEPIKGFAGHYIAAHRAGVAYGDRHIWGCEVGEPADITIASSGESERGWAAFNSTVLHQASLGTKVGGTLILFTSFSSLLRKPPNHGQEPNAEDKPSTDPFQQMLDELSFEELILEYERRNWDLSRYDFHMRRRSLWSEHHVRRPFFDHNVILVGGKVSSRILKRYNATNTISLNDAIDEAIERHGKTARVLVIPEAESTLPLEKFH